MTPETYRDILERRLCFKCRKPTHRSSAVQRQCPECRRKWSFVRAEKRWRLIECFCAGLNARRAALKVGSAYGTALNLFQKLEAQARRLQDERAERFVWLREAGEPVTRALGRYMLQFYLEIELGLPGRLMRKWR